MPRVYLDTSKVLRVPKQTVVVGWCQDPTVVCESVEHSPQGSTATFTAYAQRFDSNRAVYLTAPVLVYVEGYSNPIFRGYFDESSSVLRGEMVTIRARSALAYLRDKSLLDRAATNGAYSTVGTEVTFDTVDPYDPSQIRVYQPVEFLSFFADISLDQWWREQVAFRIDPALSDMQPVMSTVYRLGVSDGALSLVPYVATASPLGKQVFRNTTWGQLLDYILEICPGTILLERFTASKSYIYINLIGRARSFAVSVGVPGADWADVGANVTDLTVDTSHAEMYNRVAAFGAPIRFAVTLASETVDADGNPIGLIPDWPLFDLAKTDTAETRVVGCGAYNYISGQYSHSIPAAFAGKAQPAKLVCNNPDMATDGEAAFVPEYKGVCRRWRLPNWFTPCEVMQDEKLFLDESAIQVFVEMPVFTGQGQKKYQYSWIPATGWRFDWAAKAVEFDKPQICPTINTDYQLTGFYKPARVAVTFLFHAPGYQFYVDSGPPPPELATAIESGQTFIVERDDLRRVQISNAGYPLPRAYDEVLPDAVADGVFIRLKRRAQTSTVEYKDFVFFAESDGKANVIMFGARPPDDPVLQFRPHPQWPGPLTAPLLVHDDLSALWDAAVKIYHRKCRRPRAFRVDLPIVMPGVSVGQTLYINNLSNNYSPDLDIVESVTHNLREGTTAFRTTSKIADAYNTTGVTV